MNASKHAGFLTTDITVWEDGVLLYSIFGTNPGSIFAGAFGQFDDTCPVGQMIVFSRTTGETAVSQQNALPTHGVVVVVIMTDEHAFHIALFLHGSKQTGIQGRRTGFFLADAIK